MVSERSSLDFLQGTATRSTEKCRFYLSPPATVLVFGESRLLLLGPAAQRLLDVSAGLLVPSWLLSAGCAKISYVSTCLTISFIQNMHMRT